MQVNMTAKIKEEIGLTLLRYYCNKIVYFNKIDYIEFILTRLKIKCTELSECKFDSWLKAEKIR